MSSTLGLKRFLPILLLVSGVSLTAGEKVYRYEADLTRVVLDRYKVILDASDFAPETGGEELAFLFPRMIPGTYRVADYGKYIKRLRAYDADGKRLRVRRRGKNAFMIKHAERLATISYWVADTWDARLVRNRVMPMAGTNGDAGRNFVVNAAGVFGYFRGEELNPVEATFKRPAALYAQTVLPRQELGGDMIRFHAKDYHHLIDSPIMFSVADTLSFRVRNTRALIGVDSKIRRVGKAQQYFDVIGPSMEAVGDFLDSLPADNYSFIIYEMDAHALGEIASHPHFQLLRVLWFILKNKAVLGSGALEHKTSSFYFFPDFGANQDRVIERLMPSTATHEFMHIITPLTLHSQQVGNFDYENPVMSKHIWLYEGVTEYFAKLIPVRGGLVAPKDFLIRDIRPKIRRAEKFPNEELTFLEYSENILERKNRKLYRIAVQERGAILGMLLDIEIIRLTDGAKTLIDVLRELSAKYGVDRSFDENTFIAEFVSHVHPDLQSFFDRTIGGHEELPYAEIFDHVGIKYTAEVTEPRPKNLVTDNDVKAKRNIIGALIIRKVGREVQGDLQKGDIIDPRFNRRLMYDAFANYVPKGTVVDLPLIRDGEKITVPMTVEYHEKERTHKLTISAAMTAQQARYYQQWLGQAPPVAED